MRHRRHRRHNPPRGGGGLSFRHPTTLVAPALSAATGAVITAAAPKMLFGPVVDTTTGYLTNLGVAAAGAVALSWFTRPALGWSFFLGAAAITLSDPVRRALSSVFPAAVSAYPRLALGAPYYTGGSQYYGTGGRRAVSAYPRGGRMGPG